MKSTFQMTLLAATLLAAAAAQAGVHAGTPSGMGHASPMSHVGGTTANSNGPGSADRDTGAERAADRRAEPVNSEAAENSNGKPSADKDKGKDRAADRAHKSAHGHKSQ